MARGHQRGCCPVRSTYGPNLVYPCCPAGHCRRKALRRRLVRCERMGIDRASKSRRQHKLSSREPQRFGEQAYIRLQKSIELAGIANGDARDTGFHPTPKLRWPFAKVERRWLIAALAFIAVSPASSTQDFYVEVSILSKGPFRLQFCG